MFGIYEFAAEDAYRFAQSQNIRTSRRGKELQFQYCPYCKSKDKFTFSINLEDGTFNCKRNSCVTAIGRVTNGFVMEEIPVLKSVRT